MASASLARAATHAAAGTSAAGGPHARSPRRAPARRRRQRRGAPARAAPTAAATAPPAQQQQQQQQQQQRTSPAPGALPPTNGPGGEKESASVKVLDAERGYCNLTRYSPEYVRAEALRSPLAVAGRLAEIVGGVGGFALGLWLDERAGATDSNAPRRAAELRELLVRLGPSFIKAGQVLANRPDIVRADYMQELTLLQDDVPAFPDAQAVAIIERELGAKLETLFERVSATPVAAASLGQVYKAELKGSRAPVAVKVQRPGIEPIIVRDLYLFRQLARFVNPLAKARLGCNAELIVDEFGAKLLEELDYTLELSNMRDFGRNFRDDPSVKIPTPYPQASGRRVLTMEWIDGVRCTDVESIQRTLDVDNFIRVGVKSGLRQLLEFGLFHGDPHPGNIFAMPDGRIAYVDFGNVADLSQRNKEVLVDAVVHAVNEDYDSMAGDFIKLGFLPQNTDVRPFVPALEAIWQDSTTKSLSSFNFRTVTSKFNELVYEYPIRIPERYALVIRSLLTQEGICMSLEPNFKFLEVAYPYVAKRLLTDDDPGLRDRLVQVLFDDGEFQWQRLRNMIELAKGDASADAAGAAGGGGGGGLDLRDTVRDGSVFLLSAEAADLRMQLLRAFTSGSRLHVQEVREIVELLEPDLRPDALVRDAVEAFPEISRELALGWTKDVLRRR